MKRLKTAGLLCAALFLFVMSGTAQTKDDVTAAFNTAAASIKTKDYGKAVENLQKVIDLGTKVGAESDSIRKVAQNYIAKYQLQLAVAMSQDKATSSADLLAAFLKAKELSDKYGDGTISMQVDGITPKIYTNMALAAFKANDFPTALANFDKVLALDPNNTQALFGKAIVYKNQNALDPMVQTLNKTIEVATKASDTATVRKSKLLLFNEYLKQANAAYLKSDSKGTVAPLEEALKYNDKSAQAYYMMADTKNKLKDFDGALEAIAKGLPLENPAKEQLARFYYQQGVAYVGKGEKEKAVESFKQASFGRFLGPAAAQIKFLTTKPAPGAPAKK